jgi:mono/diheme cytochrome c family protein
MMLKTSLKVAALALAALAWAARAAPTPRAAARPQTEAEAQGPDSLTPERLARAKALFGEKCARCHGADGRGETVTGGMLGVPNFTDENWWKEGRSDARLLNSVTEGRDEMPAFGRKLTRREIASLVAYVRRFNKSADNAHE